MQFYMFIIDFATKDTIVSKRYFFKIFQNPEKINQILFNIFKETILHNFY